MEVLDKVNVKTPDLRKHSQPMRSSHITTMSFMRLQPVYYRHLVPGQSITVDVGQFAKLAPMQVPVFASGARLNLRAFFVPFRTVWPQWNNFITDSVYHGSSSSAIPDISPVVSNQDFYHLFMNGVAAYYDYPTALMESVSSDMTSDVVIGNDGYRFTNLGRQVYKILRSLGYAWNWDEKDTTLYSALPIMSYFRVWFDWYTSSQYMDSTEVRQIAEMFAQSSPGQFTVNYSLLSGIFRFVSYVCYDGDYFTAGWDNPNSPSSGNGSTDYVINDVSRFDSQGSSVPLPSGMATSVVSQLANGSPIIRRENTGSVYLSQYLDSSLKALTRYIKRQQLSGARSVDRYLTQFGIQLAAEKLNRCYYLGSESIDLKIGEVMQTVNTNASGVSNLGDFGGKGYSDGTAHFKCDTDEFGIFFVMASITPTGGYVQGFDRNNLHIKRLDFFTPDFDGLGPQLTAKGELFMPNRNGFYAPSAMLGGFSFVPRYAEYKVSRDFLTGDVSLPRYETSDAWHLHRLFTLDTFDRDSSNVVHSEWFTRGFDADQYNRIFNYTGDDTDKFTMIFNFVVDSYAPMKSLFDVFEFDEFGKEITMQQNGTKVN